MREPQLEQALPWPIVSHATDADVEQRYVLPHQVREQLVTTKHGDTEARGAPRSRLGSRCRVDARRVHAASVAEHARVATAPKFYTQLLHWLAHAWRVDVSKPLDAEPGV